MILALDIAFANTGYTLIDEDLNIYRIGCFSIVSQKKIVHTYKLGTKFKDQINETISVDITPKIKVNQFIKCLSTYTTVVQDFLTKEHVGKIVAEVSFLGGMSSKAVSLMSSAVSVWATIASLNDIEFIPYIPQHINKFVKLHTGTKNVSKTDRKTCLNKLMKFPSLNAKGKQEHVIDAMLVGLYHIEKLKGGLNDK